MQTDDGVPTALTRRAVVTGAGALAAAATLAATAGCSTYSDQPAGGGSTGGGSSSGGLLAKTSDIPVGGGKIFADEKVVVTQATAGKFAAVSAICTHTSCPVASVAGGTINCECHGSKYKLDGSVANGPATKPLASKSVTVNGDTITVT